MSFILLVEQTAPETPSANQVMLYPKSDGLMYSKDDAGTERAMAASAAATTDNAVARFDGVAGALQNSGIIISDTDAITGIVSINNTNIGTPTAGVLTNCTGTAAGLTAGAVTALGTPASGTLTNCTGLPAAGVVGTAITNGGALGTPASGTLTNCTGLPQAGLAASAVGQAQLKTTTASGGTLVEITSHATIALTGGTYSWWTASSSNATADSPGIMFGSTDTAAGTIGLYNDNTGAQRTFNRDERYVQASPPYTHGPLFVFLLLDALGAIINIEVGYDPTWAYHGPTDIRPQRVEGNKAFRLIETYDGLTLAEALKSNDLPLKQAILRGQIPKIAIEREITLDYKDSDMNIVPHPWVFNGPAYFTGRTVVMLEPGTPLMLRLAGIGEASHAREIRQIIVDGFLTVGNQPIVLPTQPVGVQVVRANWKLT